MHRTLTNFGVYELISAMYKQTETCTLKKSNTVHYIFNT